MYLQPMLCSHIQQQLVDNSLQRYTEAPIVGGFGEDDVEDDEHTGNTVAVVVAAAVAAAADDVAVVALCNLVLVVNV